MTGFRGSDETLEREISTLEEIGRGRLRRYAREMRELDRDLAELKRERRRRSSGEVTGGVAAESAGTA